MFAMSLELTVLGSGNYAPGRGKTVRNPAGYAVRAGQDVVLLDFGFGNLRQLARAGLRPEEVTDLFITHLHPDHCGDLPALLFAFHAGDHPKPKPGRLRIWGPAGTRDMLTNLCKAWAPWLDPRGYALEVRELNDGGEVQGVGWVVEAKSVPHTTRALAYRLSRGSSSLVYTGDMEYDPAFARFAASCDLLLVECTADADDSLPGHLSPRQALELSRAARAGKTLLTHLSDASAAAAQRLIKDDPCVALARDLMRRKF
ncbi:MAG: ribonuclease Z [Elusimicrobia bacterium]|nr:ribonuclease Z [Elusimicrobiota bacterium]